MLWARAATPAERVEAPKATGRTRALTVCTVQAVEPACAFASAPVLVCWYAPDATDQLPPDLVQPSALPSLKSSAKSVAAWAGPARATPAMRTATAAAADSFAFIVSSTRFRYAWGAQA